MKKMNFILPAILLALAFGTAQAYSLQGIDSDGNTTVIIFGSIRMPYDLNESEEILKVDTALVGAENATYQMLDDGDVIYKPVMYKPLNQGRQLVYFIIPRDSLFKMITATPTGGRPININWWATPKASNQNLLIRYYGITDWLINPDEQGIVVQVRGQNNGTRDVVFSPENFTLLDQWGWPYKPTAGFDPEVISVGGASQGRVLVGFSGISLQSRPAALVYNDNRANQILIDFVTGFVPLSDELVYGEGGNGNATSNVTSALPAGGAAVALPASVAAGQANQTAVAAAPANNTTAGNATVATNINASVSNTKARLDAMRERLRKQTEDNKPEVNLSTTNASTTNASTTNASTTNASTTNVSASNTPVSVPANMMASSRSDI